MIFNKDEKEKSKFKMKLPFVRLAQSDEKMKIPPKKYDWSQHKINLFLLKKDGKKPSEFELMGPLGRLLQEEEEIKKMKQSNFFRDVISFRQTCLEPMGHSRTVLKKLVVEDRSEWDSYWKVYEEILDENRKPEEASSKLLCRRQRLIKCSTQEEDCNFTVELPNLWFIRRQILIKFIEAVRRIVIRNRLLNHLKRLKMSQRQE